MFCPFFQCVHVRYFSFVFISFVVALFFYILNVLYMVSHISYVVVFIFLFCDKNTCYTILMLLWFVFCDKFHCIKMYSNNINRYCIVSWSFFTKVLVLMICNQCFIYFLTKLVLCQSSTHLLLVHDFEQYKKQCHVDCKIVDMFVILHDESPVLHYIC